MRHGSAPTTSGGHGDEQRQRNCRFHSRRAHAIFLPAATAAAAAAAALHCGREMSFQTKLASSPGTGPGAGGEQQKQYGLSPVISFRGPSAADLAATATLESVLRARGLFENEEEGEARETAIGQLNELVQTWMVAEGVALGALESNATAADSPGRIYTFGSFRLGVHGPGADMDTLVVGPHFITRAMFFERFYKVLEERTDLVSELAARVDAYVPVITFRFMGIEFDLLYAQMSSSLGGGLGGASFNIYDDQLLRSLDAKTVLSLNGARVTDMVLSLMPDTTVPAFRLALVFVKLWAKQRAIYSNVHGYLGGVSWAILVAHVCQLYPNASASTLIEKFFTLYKQWRWPFPISLNEPKTVSDLGLQVWNPKENFKDRADLMPIITPAYPAMCSTHNVSRATLKVLQSEFTRGHELFEKAASFKKSDAVPPEWIWDELLSPTTFFLDFADYFDIKVSSRREEDQLMWLGYVESKVRQLVLPLTKIAHLRVVPFPKNFTEHGATYTLHTYASTGEDGQATGPAVQTQEKLFVDHFFIGLEFDMVKLKEAAAAAANGAYQSTTAAAGDAAAQAQAAAPVQLNLSDPVNQFRSIVFDYFSIKDPERSARGFNCDVTHIKARQLPAFVFRDERRPEGWGKKGKGGKKRKAEAEAATAAATGAGNAAAASGAAVATTTATTAAEVPGATVDATPAAVGGAVVVKSEPSSGDSSAPQSQDNKRAKIEGEPSSEPVLLEGDKSAAPMPTASRGDDGSMSDVPAAGSVGVDSAAKSESESGTSVKVEPAAAAATPAASAAPVADSTATANPDTATHHIHEVELALPEEQIVVTNRDPTAEAAPTATATTAAPASSDASATEAAAADAAAPSALPPLIIAAEAVPTIVETQSAFELKRRAPTRGPGIKIAAAPKASPPVPAVSAAAAAAPPPAPMPVPSSASAPAPVAPAAAGAAPSALVVAPSSSSSATPAASPSPAAPLLTPVAASSSPRLVGLRPSTSPPLLPTPSPSTGAGTSTAIASPSPAAVTVPSHSPRPARSAPGAPLLSSPSPVAPGAPVAAATPPLMRTISFPRNTPPASVGAGGRIQTSDDLWDDDTSRSRQQQTQTQVQSSHSSTQQQPLLQMPSSSHNQGQQQKQQQQQQQQQQQHGSHGRGQTGDYPLLRMPGDDRQQQQQSGRRKRGGGGRNNQSGGGGGVVGMDALSQQQQMYQQQLAMQQQMALMNPMLMQSQMAMGGMGGMGMGGMGVMAMNPMMIAHQQQALLMQQQAMMMQQQQHQQQHQQRGNGF